jgi:hypothetical protein
MGIPKVHHHRGYDHARRQGILVAERCHHGFLLQSSGMVPNLAGNVDLPMQATVSPVFIKAVFQRPAPATVLSGPRCTYE